MGGTDLSGTSLSVPFPVTAWRPEADAGLRRQAGEALEQGNVVVFPDLPFPLSEAERCFLRPDAVKEGTKTIKYDPQAKRVWGTADPSGDAVLAGMLGRYAGDARSLVLSLMPGYEKALVLGNTSFRPVATENRPSSRRQDDTLLHVDAFPSRPSNGQRIMRVFTNVNPDGKPRVWRVGEPFEAVARLFLPRIGAPLPGSAAFMQLVGLTKARRSAADHYMLKLHDTMKFDEAYQRDCPRRTIAFAPGTTWMVFTDQVSHAAISGQHALEQTFTVDVDALNDPATSPLRILERLTGRSLH